MVDVPVVLRVEEREGDWEGVSAPVVELVCVLVPVWVAELDGELEGVLDRVSELEGVVPDVKVVVGVKVCVGETVLDGVMVLEAVLLGVPVQEFVFGPVPVLVGLGEPVCESVFEGVGGGVGLIVLVMVPVLVCAEEGVPVGLVDMVGGILGVVVADLLAVCEGLTVMGGEPVVDRLADTVEAAVCDWLSVDHAECEGVSVCV